MKTRLLFSLIVLVLIISNSNVWAVSTTWTGNTSTLWSDAGNWSAGLPTSTIDVIITTGTANLPTVNVASNCKSVTISGTAGTSTTITLSTALTVSGALKVNDGCSLSFAGAGAASFGAVSSVGISSAGGALLTIGTTSTISFGAKLSVIANSTLVNNGKLNSSAAIAPATSSIFTNSSTGIITLTSTASSLAFADATATINSGQIIATSKSVINTGASGTFTNSSTGIITLTAAAFNLTDGTTTNNSGQITATAAGGTVSTINTGRAGTVNNSSSGAISIDGSKLIIDNGTNVVNAGSISASNSSPITVNGDKVSLFATINNSSSGASLTLDASSIVLDFGCSITNAGAIAANNASTIKLNSNAAASLVSAITCSSGANLTLNASTLTVSNGCSVTNAGTITTSNASTVTLNGNTNTLLAVLTNNNILNATSTTFTIDGASSLKNNGALTVSSSTFTFTTAGGSNITNTGNYQDNGTTYTLQGNSAYILNTAGTFKLGSTSTITPSGANTYIENDSPGVFTLKSDATGSAAIGKLNATASCIGNFNVERFINGGGNILYRSYRFFSSPVYTSNQTVGGLTFNAYDLKYLNTTDPTYPITTGTGGTSSGFDKAGNPTIYLYREDRNANSGVFSGGNYIGISNITGTALNYDSNNNTTTTGYLPVGNGFAFFYRGTKASLTGRTTLPITAPYYPDDTKVTQVGALNTGNVLVNLWYNITTPNSNQNTLSFSAANTSVTQGINLVGNPYPCAIDWNTYFGNAGISTTNVLPSIYVFDPLNKQYDVYLNTAAGTGLGNPASTSSIIASGQGFFVTATAPTAQLTFKEAAKATASPNQSTLLMGVPQGQNNARQLLRLKLFIDSVNYDDIAIGFNSNSSAKYNNMEDSQYLAGVGAAEGLASFSADNMPVPLAINFLPLPKKTQQVIRLKVDAATSGQLTLKRVQLDSLPKIYELWLIDKYKKDSLDLRNNADYAFAVDKADTASYGNNRFQVIIRQNKALKVHLLDFTADKNKDEVPIKWKTENEENYTNFTVERSTDNGITFNVLGGFASNSQGVYTFEDKNPVKTVDIYRLKLEDLNGDITYSKWVTVVYDQSKIIIAKTSINVFPNPSTGPINVAIREPGLANDSPGGPQGSYSPPGPTPIYAIKIISVTGAVIKTALSASPAWQDNVSNLLPGTYFIRVVNKSDNSLVGKTSFVKL